jgi:hypothetical protein
MQRNFGNCLPGNRCDVSLWNVRGYDPLESVERNGGAEMDRRKERRVNLELPVRIWGVDRMARPFAEIVRVRNVSDHGAVLIGMRSKVATGELLDVQLGASRAQFRIVWMSLSGEAGIQALAFEPPILGIGLPKVFEMVGTG